MTEICIYRTVTRYDGNCVARESLSNRTAGGCIIYRGLIIEAVILVRDPFSGLDDSDATAFANAISLLLLNLECILKRQSAASTYRRAVFCPDSCE